MSLSRWDVFIKQPVKNQLSVKSVGPISEPGLHPLLHARRQQQQRRWSSSSVKEPQQQPPPQQPPQQQQEEEEVGGALTKVMEALGFTGPLKYSKWVSEWRGWGQEVRVSPGAW